MYSMTPIMLTLLNLPRHIRNAFANIMLVGIIPGSKTSEAQQLDPYLAILVDELLFLTGCTVYSEYKTAPVEVKIKLLLFVLDYPGLSKVFKHHGSGSLSGCHWCMVRGMHCSHLSKVVYLSNRSFLPADDPIRNDVENFIDKKRDLSSKPRVHSKEREMCYREAYARSTNKTEASVVATATGCKGMYELAKLPGHNRLKETVPDACHTIKDVVKNVLDFITRRSKNLVKAVSAEEHYNRLSAHKMEDSTVNRKHIFQSQDEHGPKAKKQKRRNNSTEMQHKDKVLPFVLTENEPKVADQKTLSVRVPIGFGLKVSNFISKSGSLKSYDWKQIAMHGILKVCLKDTLSQQCRQTLFLLLDSLAELCAECQSEQGLDEIEIRLNRALVLLERDFPIALQNITTHLLHHIVEGIRNYGPVYSTWMFVFERFNSWICKRALNMRYPEATVVETFIIYDFCQFMISSGRMPTIEGNTYCVPEISDDGVSASVHEDYRQNWQREQKTLKSGQLQDLPSIPRKCKTSDCSNCCVEKYFRHETLHPITKRTITYSCSARELSSARTVSSIVCREKDRGTRYMKVQSGKFLEFGRIQYFLRHHGNPLEVVNLTYVRWFVNVVFDADSHLWYTSLNPAKDMCKHSYALVTELSSPLVTARENELLWFLDSGKLPCARAT